MSRPSTALINYHRRLQQQYESLTDGVLRCPVCWEVKGVSEFTSEHIPPQGVNELVGEGYVRGLVTCGGCNHSFGGAMQNDLIQLVRYQRFVHGVGDEIPGEFRIEGVEGALRANISWPIGGTISVVGVRKANNPTVVDKHVNAMKNPGASSFTLSSEFFYPERALWALLHSAYMVLVDRTEYGYAYSGTGASVRKLLDERVQQSVANYCLATRRIPISGPVAVMGLESPKQLHGFLVKVAGQLIPMPSEGTAESYFMRWWRRSHMDRWRMVLVPHVRTFRLAIRDEDRDVLQHLRF